MKSTNRLDWRVPHYNDSSKIDLSTNVCHDIHNPSWVLDMSKYCDEYKAYDILATHYDVSVDNICIGLGLSELVTRILTYIKLAGLTLDINDSPTWALVNAVKNALDIPDGDDVTYTASPNGITGQVTGIKRGRVLSIMDLSYDDFADKSQFIRTECSKNTVYLKTLSKSLGIPGVRFGWAIGASRIISEMQEIRPGHVVVGDIDRHLIDMLNHIPHHVSRMLQTRKFLEENYQCKKSQGNFVLFAQNIDAIEERFKIKNINGFKRMSLTNLEYFS